MTLPSFGYGVNTTDDDDDDDNDLIQNSGSISSAALIPIVSIFLALAILAQNQCE